MVSFQASMPTSLEPSGLSVSTSSWELRGPNPPPSRTCPNTKNRKPPEAQEKTC